MLRYAMLCYAMLCYAMLCWAMRIYICYSILCYAVLCCAVLCYAIMLGGGGAEGVEREQEPLLGCGGELLLTVWGPRSLMSMFFMLPSCTAHTWTVRWLLTYSNVLFAQVENAHVLKFGSDHYKNCSHFCIWWDASQVLPLVVASYCMAWQSSIQATWNE